MADDKSISAIGAPVFSAADATNPPLPSQSDNDARKAAIRVPAPTAASDGALVANLTRLVNGVYGEAEGTIYKTAFERTSAPQIEAYLRAGELAVAFLRSTDDDDDDDDDDDGNHEKVDSRSSAPEGITTPTPRGKKLVVVVGCVFVKKLSPTTGGFGMLAVDPTYRGTGLGRDLVRFAEERCRRDLGLAVVRLELLVPMHFEHVGKARLQAWYTRLGYVMTGLHDFGETHPRLNAALAGPTEYRIFEKRLVA
ncbi:hypothetical protein F5B21DRAFT_399204 [Xylaria acuta]|nr:hypothetical protein F5B21DRAFT_399204 [Xylaria acuta]